MNIAAAVRCFKCLQPVSVHDVDLDGVCVHCNELKARVGLDDDGHVLGGDAGVHLDERAGEILANCDEY